MESRHPQWDFQAAGGDLQYLRPKLNNIKNVQHPRAPSNFKFKTRGSPAQGRDPVGDGGGTQGTAGGIEKGRPSVEYGGVACGRVPPFKFQVAARPAPVRSQSFAEQLGPGDGVTPALALSLRRRRTLSGSAR